MENKSISFELYRGADFSQTSGTGHVLSGVIFTTSGKVIIDWHSKSGVSSLGVYDSYFDFYKIHIASHPDNKSLVVFAQNDLTIENSCFCGNSIEEHPTDNQEDLIKFNVRLCNGKIKNLI
jgi:hypothetical protein